jgi:hypothetical protein
MGADPIGGLPKGQEELKIEGQGKIHRLGVVNRIAGSNDQVAAPRVQAAVLPQGPI